MRRKVLLVLMAVLLVAPGMALAQMQRGMGGHGMMMMGPGMQQNMGMMSQMMGEMHQMMAQGNMSAEQHMQMMSIMNKMGHMMQQMSGPEGTKMMAQNREELMVMQKQLNTIKQQMKK